MTKPVTPHPLSKQKGIEKIVERNTKVLAPGPSRNSTPNVTIKTVKESVGSNEMVKNHRLQEARNKTKQ